MYFAKGRKLGYLNLGSTRAKAKPIKLLGIKEGESWFQVGVTFTVIISVITGAFLFVGYSEQLAGVDINSWALALLIALPLSVINSFNEEIITRWAKWQIRSLCSVGFGFNFRISSLFWRTRWSGRVANGRIFGMAARSVDPGHKRYWLGLVYSFLPRCTDF